ncbi:phosphoglycerate mutase [Tahibacter amnicola]|uniref:Phosphoglycerate mutase n=1 Tax=Tahibacter amnicola TaxID=2976241 RepID=A0ABY6B8K9_9GAMM|nr:phosphoglycerate mutase [Tahibacter amnicola]UXI66413.1 phosphoglycerate mutase [Tahibacter amnicola]
MSELSLLLPPLDRLARHGDAARGALAVMVARGDRRDPSAPGREALIREHFQFTGTGIPTAALTRYLDAPDAAGAGWLRADPAYLRADMATARLMACGDMGLSAEECAELLRPLRPLLGDAGFPIDAPVPSRWYLRAAADAKLPVFAEPGRVLGDDLRQHMPEGPAGARWRALLNEVQIVLHNHPLNAERIARGQVPVNSLWFWGFGVLPDWVKTRHSAVYCEDPILTALARIAQVRTTGRGEAAVETLSATPTPLLDLDDADALAGWSTRWEPLLADVLSTKRVSAIHLHFASGQRYTFQPGHRWRFWRRIKPLTA